jgi:hypothetical protein
MKAYIDGMDIEYDYYPAHENYHGEGMIEYIVADVVIYSVKEDGFEVEDYDEWELIQRLIILNN